MQLLYRIFHLKIFIFNKNNFIFFINLFQLTNIITDIQQAYLAF